jgi:hypothetical protein
MGLFSRIVSDATGSPFQPRKQPLVLEGSAAGTIDQTRTTSPSAAGEVGDRVEVRTLREASEASLGSSTPTGFVSTAASDCPPSAAPDNRHVRMSVPRPLPGDSADRSGASSPGYHGIEPISTRAQPDRATDPSRDTRPLAPSAGNAAPEQRKTDASWNDASAQTPRAGDEPISHVDHSPPAAHAPSGTLATETRLPPASIEKRAHSGVVSAIPASSGSSTNAAPPERDPLEIGASLPEAADTKGGTRGGDPGPPWDASRPASGLRAKRPPSEVPPSPATILRTQEVRPTVAVPVRAASHETSEPAVRIEQIDVYVAAPTAMQPQSTTSTTSVGYASRMYLRRL